MTGKEETSGDGDGTRLEASARSREEARATEAEDAAAAERAREAEEISSGNQQMKHNK